MHAGARLERGRRPSGGPERWSASQRVLDPFGYVRGGELFEQGFVADPGTQFEFGRQRVLDGFELFAARGEMATP